MKKFLISVKTLHALEKSIRKWERVVAKGVSGLGSSGCGLCELYQAARGVYSKPCDGCPIMMDKGRRMCLGTPYVTYARAKVYGSDYGSDSDAAREARRELSYLKDLQSRCEVVPRMRKTRIKEQV